ncbi:protein of unknown function [Moritella yayanosii]|uniref:Uncharacterized protein n=1 Tax=Moritella yayanosii TaxID=69539 RepID=A0A330LP86_9GAMM|nr:protein of unknown function [Moritella yayanosii]
MNKGSVKNDVPRLQLSHSFLVFKQGRNTDMIVMFIPVMHHIFFTQNKKGAVQITIEQSQDNEKINP